MAAKFRALLGKSRTSSAEENLHRMIQILAISCQAAWEQQDAMCCKAMHDMSPDHVHEELEFRCEFSSQLGVVGTCAVA